MLGLIVLACIVAGALPALADGPVIVAFGDSITFGAGVQPEDAYPAQLQVLLRERTNTPDLSVVNAGVGGNTARQGLARLDKDVLACHPCAVLIGFGMNDAVMTAANTPRSTTDDFRQTMTEIVQRIQAAGAKTILAPVTPVIEQYYWERHPQEWYPDGLRAQLDRYTAVIREVARQTGSTVIDLGNFNPSLHLRTPENSGARDGVHPTPGGYTVIATAYAQKLVPTERP